MLLPDTTLDISVDLHLAAKGIPAAQQRVDAHPEGRRAHTPEEALRLIRAWIDHWDEDRACNLTPTEGSLADARETIDAALSACRSVLS